MPQINIRWADNTDELKKNLKEGVQQIEASTKAVAALSKSLSGENLINAAHKYAAAVEQIGGASKLTGANQERVNSIMKRAVEQMEAAGNGGSALATHFRELASATAKTESPLDRFKSGLLSINGLLGGLGLGLSVGAVVSFGKALLADADALTKMADKTGISVEGLQRMQIVGDDAGNTIDQMTGAVNQMQNRLAKGDDSALAALKKLGLEFEDIKHLNPENQFVAISDAIRKIQDPAQQVNIAMALFGKTGAEVLPSLKKGFDDVKDSAAVMSEETVRAFDEAGDTIARWWRVAKGVTAEATVGFVHLAEAGFTPAAYAAQTAVRELEALTRQLERMTKAIPHPASIAAAPLVVTTSDSPQFERASKEIDDGLRKIADAARRAAEAHAQLVLKLHDVERAGYTDSVAMRIMAQELVNVGAKDDDVLRLAKVFDDLDAAVRRAEASINHLSTIRAAELIGGATIDSRITVPTGTTTPLPTGAGFKQGQDLGAALKAGFDQGIADLPNSILRAIQGGGSIAGAVAGTIGSSIGESINTSLQASISKGMKGIAGTITSALSGLIPVVGSLLGPLIDKLFSIGGPSKLEVAGRDLQASFQGQFSSFEDMVNSIGRAYALTGKTLEQARADVKSLLDAEKEGPAAVQAIIDKLQGALNAAKEIDAAINGLGIKSKDDLQHAADIAREAFEKVLAGVKTGQYTEADALKAEIAYQKAIAALGGEAGKAAEAWLRLHDAAYRAGEAQSEAMKKAEKELSDLIQKRDSLAGEIAKEAPEEFIGVIEQQQRAELKVLDDQIQQKADAYAKLAKDTGQAMADAIKEALEKLHVVIHVDYNLPTAPPTPSPSPSTSPTPGNPTYVDGASTGGYVTPFGIQHFALGGSALPSMAIPTSLFRPMGSDTVPAMLTPGEVVLPRGQVGGFGDSPRVIQRLDAIIAAIYATESHFSLGDDDVANAYHRSLDRNGGGNRTAALEILGIT